MIVVRLHGGLGNQMFQYAYGRALMGLGSGPVVYEATSYAEDRLRDFGLNVWSVDLPLLPAEKERALASRYGGLGRKGWLHGVRPLRKVAERPFGFDPRFLQVRDNTHLIGYWQDERFFESVGEEIRNHFKPAQPVTEKTARVVDQVVATNSVAVHVRRTDYLKHAEMQVCDAGYHRRCVEMLLAKHSGLEAYVFSDDLAWCRANLELPCPTHYVDHTTAATAHEDLWMMSRCRHQVIPNSSFSWWAAWLKLDPSGETFAPSPWFNNPERAGEGVACKNWRIVPGTENTAAAA